MMVKELFVDFERKIVSFSWCSKEENHSYLQKKKKKAFNATSKEK